MYVSYSTYYWLIFIYPLSIALYYGIIIIYACKHDNSTLFYQDEPTFKEVFMDGVFFLIGTVILWLGVIPFLNTILVALFILYIIMSKASKKKNKEK